MHKVSSKRQVTLPKDLCDLTGILPGDYVEIFEFNGKLTVIKKIVGSSAGSLKHLKPLDERRGRGVCLRCDGEVDTGQATARAACSAATASGV